MDLERYRRAMLSIEEPCSLEEDTIERVLEKKPAQRREKAGVAGRRPCAGAVMAQRFTFRKSLAAAGAVCVAAACLSVGLLGTQGAEGDTPQTLREKIYASNEGGMTYGNVSEAPSGDLEPDLIEAIATNGHEGYIKREELDEATRANASSPDLLQFQEECEERAVGLMQRELGRRVVGGSVSAEVARCVLEEVMNWGSDEAMRAALAQADGDEGAAVAGGLSLDDCIESYFAVDEAMTTYIPVYEQDGVTEIGRFPVGCL